MLETLSEDFVRTARAKGAPKRRVYGRHALRAAITPMVTIAGLDVGSALGGTVITETTFGLQGLGRTAVDAVRQGDLPTIMATVLIAAVFVVVANLVVDLLYAVIDPRVRLRMSGPAYGDPSSARNAAARTTRNRQPEERGMRARLVTAAGGALALAVALGACTKNTGQDDDVLDPNQVRTGAIATDPTDSKGPAPEVPGATRGGTFHILRESKISHLDPQRAYSFAGLMGSQLYARSLTAFTDDGKGNVTLVGDLAETPGMNVNSDCKVWEFKIKDGVKFEDGTAITSKEIAYGIARSFDPN